MRDLMNDYRRLVSLHPDEVVGWVHGEFPEGVRGQWIGAMLDIAITDFYPVNESPEVSMKSRLVLAESLLKLAEDSGRMRGVLISDWYMKFSRKALEAGFSDAPSTMKADAVAQRALRCLELPPDEALVMAAGRKLRLKEGSRCEEDRRLLTVLHVIPQLLWFSGKIADHKLDDEVASWFEMKSRGVI